MAVMQANSRRANVFGLAEPGPQLSRGAAENRRLYATSDSARYHYVEPCRTSPNKPARACQTINCGIVCP